MQTRGAVPGQPRNDAGQFTRATRAAAIPLPGSHRPSTHDRPDLQRCSGHFHLGRCSASDCSTWAEIRWGRYEWCWPHASRLWEDQQVTFPYHPADPAPVPAAHWYVPHPYSALVR